MGPRVQYISTHDGVSIAYSIIGAGMPLLYMPPMAIRHLELEWQFPEDRQWFERLAEKRKLIQYDPRGMGLSERQVPLESMDGFLSDVDAVLDRVGSGPVAIFACLSSGPLAIAYTVRHPERVSHLILWCAAARIADTLPPQVETLGEVLDRDWELFTEAIGHTVRGWSAGEASHRYAAFIRECVTKEAMRALIGLARTADVRHLLPDVRCPTLVLHRRELTFLKVDLARELASRIPGARLTVLEGTLIPPSFGDTEAVLRLLDEFLGGEATVPSPGAPGLATILFTDVEGSTALTERLGDTRAREVLRIYERLVREALRAHGGSEVKAMGDGFMASFATATRALTCAIAMQKGFAAHNQANTETALRVRVGINAGEPVSEGSDLFGTAVNLAARVAAEAEPGQILVSDVVRQLAAGKGFYFDDRGERSLRGFGEPVRLFAVRV